MAIKDWIPGANFVSHVWNNLGKGLKEEGLWGACKVIAKGLASDTALGVAAAVLAIPATGGASLLAVGGLTAAGVASAAGTAAAVAGGSAVADFFNWTELKSERQARLQAEAASSAGEGGATPQPA